MRGTLRILRGHMEPTIPVTVAVAHREPFVRLVEKGDPDVRGKRDDDFGVVFGCYPKRDSRRRGSYLGKLQGTEEVDVAGYALGAAILRRGCEQDDPGRDGSGPGAKVRSL